MDEDDPLPLSIPAPNGHLIPSSLHMLVPACASGLLNLSFLLNTVILVHEGVCMCTYAGVLASMCVHSSSCDAMLHDDPFDCTLSLSVEQVLHVLSAL